MYYVIISLAGKEQLPENNILIKMYLTDARSILYTEWVGISETFLISRRQINKCISMFRRRKLFFFDKKFAEFCFFFNTTSSEW